MIKRFIAILILGVIAGGTSSWADDNGSDDSKQFPSRMQTTPPPAPPQARVTTVPQQQQQPQTQSGRMVPDSGSAAGLGVSIPLGRPKQKPIKPDTEQKDDDQTDGQ